MEEKVGRQRSGMCPFAGARRHARSDAYLTLCAYHGPPSACDRKICIEQRASHSRADLVERRRQRACGCNPPTPDEHTSPRGERLWRARRA